jgi:hypothetical protein
VASGPVDVAEQLAKLSDLHREGGLTNEEFSSAKLLGCA